MGRQNPGGVEPDAAIQRYGHVNFGLLPVLCGLEIAGFAVGLALAKRTPTGVLRNLIGGVCCALGLVLLVRELAG